MIAGGELVNSRGEAFLAKYDPVVVKIGTTMEWNKIFISLASALEVREGQGSPRGGVYYQLGDTPWHIFQERASPFFPNWRYKAADYSDFARMLKEGEAVEVGPVVEYFEGGVLVDEDFFTGVEGLYAAGECTTSLFGANRVAAATTEMLVEGAIAGRRAGRFAMRCGSGGLPQHRLDELKSLVFRPLTRNHCTRPAELRSRIQVAAHEKLGPVRCGTELEEFLAFIQSARREVVDRLSCVTRTLTYNKEWIEALELRNIVELLEISATAALTRKESRGVHYRKDHPYSDNERWLLEITFQRHEDEMRMDTRPVITSTLQPPTGVVPFLDMMKSMMLAHSEVGGHH